MNRKEREIKHLENMTFDINTDLLYLEDLQTLYTELKKNVIDYEYLAEINVCPSFYRGLCNDQIERSKVDSIRKMECVNCWKKALK